MKLRIKFSPEADSAPTEVPSPALRTERISHCADKTDTVSCPRLPLTGANGKTPSHRLFPSIVAFCLFAEGNRPENNTMDFEKYVLGLCQRHSQSLLVIALGMGRKDEAEDDVQDFFAKLLAKGKPIPIENPAYAQVIRNEAEPNEQFRAEELAWISTGLINAILNKIRAKGTGKRGGGVPDLSIDDKDSNVAGQITDAGEAPSVTAAVNLDLGYLDAKFVPDYIDCIKGIKEPRQKAAYIYRFIGGLEDDVYMNGGEIKAASKELGITEAQLSSILQKACRYVEACLRGKGWNVTEDLHHAVLNARFGLRSQFLKVFSVFGSLRKH